MTVTIHDVARACGLSTATVSRALNGKDTVREETKDLVLREAARLRWVPNGAAQSLTTRRARTIGVLLPDVYGDFFSEVIRGISGAARLNGYHIILSGAHGDISELGNALRAMRGRVDGLLVMAPDLSADQLENLTPAHVPLLLLNVPGKGTPYGSLEVDNHGGGLMVTRHLLDLGHRRVAVIRGPVGNRDAEERLRGWREALRAAGIKPTDDLVLQGDFGEETGYNAGRLLVALKPRPTAVFASNDAMAIACLAALRSGGLSVPEEMAIAGFDDIPVARYVNPPLTTAHVSLPGLGSRAMERLLGAVEAGEPDQRHEAIKPTLVVRTSCGSTGKPARNHRTKRALASNA